MAEFFVFDDWYGTYWADILKCEVHFCPLYICGVPLCREESNIVEFRRATINNALRTSMFVWLSKSIFTFLMISQMANPYRVNSARGDTSRSKTSSPPSFSTKCRNSQGKWTTLMRQQRRIKSVGETMGYERGVSLGCGSLLWKETCVTVWVIGQLGLMRWVWLCGIVSKNRVWHSIQGCTKLSASHQVGI